MPESSHLVPNLNEIMEDEETVQATHAVARKGEERVEVNEELEQTVEESRKRK